MKVRVQISGLVGRAAEARAIIRGLIDTITLHPEGDTLRIEIRGELTAILGMSSNRDSVSAADLSVQIKMVAGTRNRLDLLLVG